MRAVIAAEPGGPEVLTIVERPQPQPGPGELLVAVHATAVNRADANQRAGKYYLPEGSTDVIGLEFAGEVVEVGSEVSGWQVGDRVCALSPGGGHAEFVTVPASIALPVPANLSYEEGAALPEVFITAYDNLVRRGDLQPGKRVLLHGGAGGVGTAGIQIARQFDCEVFVTCAAGKIDACIELGATAGIDYRSEDFVERTLELTDGLGVDVIMDHVGAPYLDRNLDVLATDGRLVYIGTLHGEKAELDIRKVLMRRLWVTGTRLRPRPTEEKADLAGAVRRDLWPHLESGAMRPVIDRVYDWEDVADAHRRMEASDHIGKIVLRVRGQGN